MKSRPEPYNQYSLLPPTRAQCEDSGSSVWNAVGAFYSSQPPPPERTMPYFESLFSRPFLMTLLIAAVNKLDPALSKQETNFEYVENMLRSVSLFNEFGDLLGIYGDGVYDVDKPIPLNTLQQCVADLKPRAVVAVFVEAVRQLLELLLEYRNTYNTVANNSVSACKKLLERMLVVITDLESSGNVSAEQFYTM